MSNLVYNKAKTDELVEQMKQKGHIVPLNDLSNMIRQSGLELSVTDAARKWLATEGYDPIYGARPVKRVIQTHIVNNLSRAILAGSIDRTKPITIDATDQGIVFNN